MICKFFSLSADHYVNYTEDSDLDYKVYYNDNSFFDDNYADKSSKYIASLIKNINADFSYNITFLENNIDFDYTYKIIANVSVLDGEDKEKLYNHNDVLFESGILKGASKTNINKTVDIDYNKYNALISKFVNTYDLRDVESSLNVSMYISMRNSGSQTIEKLNKKALISLKIPLTKRTVGIDLSRDLTKSSNRKLLIKNNINYKPLLFIGITELSFTLIVIIIVVMYYRKNRTIKNIYDREIRKILNNYDGYIQKISSKYKIGTSQVIKVESFDDMLEIRDTLKTPILMLENEIKDGTFFIIPAANGIIYAYALRMVDIIAQKKGIDAPDYDLKNIDKKIPKKYTAEFIDKQIEETRSMKALDIRNIIKGTKEKDANLYDQLDKTIITKPIKSARKTTKKEETEKKVTKKTTKKDNETKKKTVKSKITKKEEVEDKVVEKKETKKVTKKDDKATTDKDKTTEKKSKTTKKDDEEAKTKKSAVKRKIKK